ncbi:MAG TPA: hypothetical protein VFS40_08200 [Gemmatimonadales bacterium]|nr:hypothetical protein [Gemmatimonadales bacterium]
MRAGLTVPTLSTVLALLALAGCADARAAREAAMLTGGSPARGRAAIQTYGCGACHTIPGVPGANALVGPDLRGVGQRAYVAGVLANTPANLTRWIMNPPAVDSLTAMPYLGVSAPDARDIAAYLYSLR